MHTSDYDARKRDAIQQAEQIANAATDSSGEIVRTGAVRFCDVDLPFIIADGEVYIQASFTEFFDAVQAALSYLLSNLEAGVSEARSAALASRDSFDTVPVARMVEQNVVRDSREWR